MSTKSIRKEYLVIVLSVLLVLAVAVGVIGYIMHMRVEHASDALHVMNNEMAVITLALNTLR